MPEATGGGGGGGPATFDALAELFLGAGPTVGSDVTRGGLEGTERTIGGPETVEHLGGGVPAPARLEAVIAGHLPVRAGPWVTQYAGALAERDGRVIGLARLMGGHAFVDVFGLPEDRRTGHERATIEEALAHVGGVCDGWIAQVEDLDEPGLVSSPGLEAVTLLTGANDAAVVDAYRTLKSLVGEEGRDAGPRPRLRLAVMGAGAEEAAGALERIARASHAFLHEPIELAGWIERMEPRSATPVFRGETELSASDLLAALRRGGAADGGPNRTGSPPEPEAVARAKTGAEAAPPLQIVPEPEPKPEPESRPERVEGPIGADEPHAEEAAPVRAAVAGSA